MGSKEPSTQAPYERDARRFIIEGTYKHDIESGDNFFGIGAGISL